MHFHGGIEGGSERLSYILTEVLCRALSYIMMLLCISCYMDVLEKLLVTFRLSRKSPLLRNSNFQCWVYRSLPLDSLLGHLNSLCTFTTSFMIILVILSLCLSCLCYLCCPSHPPWYNRHITSSYYGYAVCFLNIFGFWASALFGWTMSHDLVTVASAIIRAAQNWKPE